MNFDNYDDKDNLMRIEQSEQAQEYKNCKNLLSPIKKDPKRMKDERLRQITEMIPVPDGKLGSNKTDKEKKPHSSSPANTF